MPPCPLSRASAPPRLAVRRGGAGALPLRRLGGATRATAATGVLRRPGGRPGARRLTVPLGRTRRAGGRGGHGTGRRRLALPVVAPEEVGRSAGVGFGVEADGLALGEGDGGAEHH